MSDDDLFTTNEELEIHRCYTCGIIFAMPTAFVENRKKDGLNFYCPNSHCLAFPTKDDNGETDQEKIERLEEENRNTKSRNIKLMSQLDQAQAHIANTPPGNTEEKND
jgi:hypothetical protein